MFLQNLKEELDHCAIETKQNVCLASYTTMNVGGSADLFVEVKDSVQLETTVKMANKLDIPLLLIGKGSNIIVSESGFRGLAILNNSNQWKIFGKPDYSAKRSKTLSRFKTIDSSYDLNDTLTYTDEFDEDVIVRVDSGLKINPLMKVLFNEGITGLQWFSGIPATVGGAIYMNMHGGDHYFGDLVEKARITNGNNTREVKNDYLKFAYDWSILHQTKEVVLWADLCLKKGDVQKAKELARNWAKIKSLQPQRSAGCIFRNLTEEEQNKHNLPTPGTGYLIDKVLNLKGKQKGGAVISEKHAAFIENTGNANSNDVVYLIRLIQDEAKNKLGINLITEIELIGEF